MSEGSSCNFSAARLSRTFFGGVSAYRKLFGSSTNGDDLGVQPILLLRRIRKQRHTIAQGFIWCQKSPWNWNITPTGVPKIQVGRFKSAIFDQYVAISQKRCKIGTYLLWKANRNSYALYRMAIFSMTLGEPKAPRFLHFATLFIFP